MPVAISPGEYAAQRGNGLHKWVNDKTASGSEQVLTDATLYYNLAEGDVVMITGMDTDLESVNDDCDFTLVSCTAVAGGGDATELIGKSHLYTPANRSESAPHEHHFHPPIRVRYADSVRSISIQIEANDSSAVISCGWQGYIDLSLPN